MISDVTVTTKPFATLFQKHLLSVFKFTHLTIKLSTLSPLVSELMGIETLVSNFMSVDTITFYIKSLNPKLLQTRIIDASHHNAKAGMCTVGKSYTPNKNWSVHP